jgi:Inner membrane component of T3SS, cytoplasmic domain
MLIQQQAMRRQRASRQRASRQARTSSSDVSSRMTAEAPVGHSQHVFVLAQVRPPSSRSWTLNSDSLTIGRDPSSDIFVDDPGISRHHADLVRHGRDWSITDAGSTNGTSVNGASVRQMTLRPGDRIEVGETELILTHAGGNSPDYQRGIRYEVEAQMGNISNVAGNQANYYRESNLGFIASRRGRARLLIISGIFLFFGGVAVVFADILSFDNDVFSFISSGIANSGNPNTVPNISPPGYFIPVSGLGVLMVLLGIALFVFGLITRSSAKRQAQDMRIEW